MKRATVKKRNAKKQAKPIASPPKNRAGETLEEVQRLVHLLQVYRVELEHQNQELKTSEEELEVSKNRYVNLFDFSPIPYFVLDLDGVIREVNLSASTMLGIERSHLIGRNMVAYIPLNERDTFKAFLKIVFAKEVKQSCKLAVINKAKRICYVQLEGLELEDALQSNRQCQVAVIDLTEKPEKRK